MAERKLRWKVQVKACHLHNCTVCEKAEMWSVRMESVLYTRLHSQLLQSQSTNCGVKMHLRLKSTRLHALCVLPAMPKSRLDKNTCTCERLKKERERERERETKQSCGRGKQRPKQAKRPKPIDCNNCCSFLWICSLLLCIYYSYFIYVWVYRVCCVSSPFPSLSLSSHLLLYLNAVTPFYC